MTERHPPAWPREAWDYDQVLDWEASRHRTEADKNAVNTAARYFQDWLDRLSKRPTKTLRKNKAKALADEFGAAYGPMSYYAEHAN